MSEKFVTHAFVAGELSRQFYGRTDLDKYDLGVAQAENFYVDYRGGLKTRAGTRFHAHEKGAGVRYFPFRTGEAASDILVIVGVGYIRFAQNGAYLLETAKTIVNVVGDVVTVTAHGYNTGDWVHLSGSGYPPGEYIVTNLTADTFRISAVGGTLPSSTVFGAGTAARVLELSAPYTAQSLPRLKAHQRRLSLVLTSVQHRPWVLELNPTTGAWTFNLVQFGGEIPPPTFVTLTPSATGSARIVATVTSVDENGVESFQGIPAIITNSVNFTATAGSLAYNWTEVPGAAKYRVYRSILSENANMTRAQEVGFIGETAGRNFIDNNIIPDFTRKPPQAFDPFTVGSVLKIQVTNRGSGYGAQTEISIAGGTGFIGYPLIIGGEIDGIIILRGGTNYAVGSTITLTNTGGGTGAVLSVTEVSPGSGNNPRVCTTFQQRRVYAGTQNLPMTVFGSRPGAPNNFDTSPFPTDDDAYFFTVDASEVVPIKHLIPIRDGLIVFHRQGVDRLVAESGRAVTPLNRYVENQAVLGVGDADPVLINNDIIYATARGSSVYSLTYTFYTNSYTPQDVSILSSHLLGPGRQPARFVWSEEPDKVLWIIREDGRMLSLTYHREQEIFGWAQHWTRGWFLDGCVLREGDRDVVYFLIQRLVNGQLVWLRESYELRDRTAQEEFWAVDSGLSYEGTRPNATIRVDEEALTITASGSVFSSALPGDVVRVSGGIYEIVSVTSGTVVVVRSLRRAMLRRPGRDEPRTGDPGQWTLARPISEIGGLAHLEGETVSILADGDAVGQKVVEGGKITLDRPAFYIVVGLPFEATARTLPLSIPQITTDGKRKRVIGTAIRVNETRGLETGSRLSAMWEMKDKGYEDWGDAIPLRSDNSLVMVAARWDYDASLTFRQRYPLPASILGLVTEAEQSD